MPDGFSYFLEIVMLIVGDYILELFLLADPLASPICFAGEMRLLDFFLGILAFFSSSFGL